MQPIAARSIDDHSPLRIGVISPHLRNHNGAIWSLGWLEKLAGDPGYQLYSYNVGDQEDEGTQRFAQLGTYRHLPISADDPISHIRQIKADNLDVLIFTDIGMHPRSKILSILNLARVQVQGWGHPVTSGSSAMNYYLSGADMETADSDEHYTETLWRLPSTGLVYLKPLAINDGTHLFEKLSLPSDRPLLLSLQSTFKYIPEYDHVYAKIIKNNPEALILFAGHMGCEIVGERFLQRLLTCAAQLDVKAENNLRMLPRLDYPDFMGLFSIAHHTLDTIGWNGGNSSFQSFSLNCPVVTLPTQLMRGRHTLSMLMKMGIDTTVALDIDDYISISTRLLKDTEFYESTKARIAQSHELLFNDQTVASAFADFITEICSPGHGG
jgi:predicted O-linked N-acetylglucosamine transferase (SPINDLY family)